MNEHLLKLQHDINIKLNSVFSIIFISLLYRHKHTWLSTKHDYSWFKNKLSIQKDINENTYGVLLRILASGMKEQPDNLFINISLQENLRYYDSKVSFPLYAMLQDEDNKVFGNRVKTRDREIYKFLYQAIVEEIEQAGYYNCCFKYQTRYEGNDMEVKCNPSPGFVCLIKTSGLLAKGLLAVLDKFKDYVDKSERLEIELSWLDMFNEIDKLLES